MTTEELLRMTLQLGVPFVIHDIRERGGPQQSDWNRMKAFAQDIATHGDLLLYRSDRAGALCARLMSALAVLSFLPGGVTFVGLHFETIQEEV